MARKYKVKCPLCGEYFYREDEPYKIYKNRFYHIKCYNELDKEELDKEKLEEYIKELYNIETITPLIKTQIKRYVSNEYNYTYSGIMGSLDYFYNIKKGDIHKTKGIGIVPYVYEEARDYFAKLNNISDINRGIEINKNIIDVFIKKPKRQPIKKIYELDINLEGCEDE